MEEYLSQGIDYIGFLEKQLRDLRGDAVLVYELIQNADDAKDVSYISFDVRDDALIVENDGIFSDCGTVNSSPICSWVNQKGHKCDFHRLMNVAGGDKRNEAGNTGAFGVGFISVYQITDHPELFSNGRHWILNPEASESRRIKEEHYSDNQIKTKFRLPWATDANSLLRTRLKVEPVSKDKISKFLEETEHVVSNALIFLKKINKIQLLHNGKMVQTVERIKDKNQVLIEVLKGEKETKKTIIWDIIQSSFPQSAQRMRTEHPTLIEPSRKDIVEIAIPQGMDENIGYFFAFLPTQQSNQFPFHLNADFFPTSDRKRIHLGDDFQGKWNKAAIEASAIGIAENLNELIKLISVPNLWKLIANAKKVYDEASGLNESNSLKIYWEKLHPKATMEKLIWNSHKTLCKPVEVFLLQKPEELESLPVLEKIGISIVHTDLRKYRTVLMCKEVGVTLLTAKHLAQSILNLKLITPLPLNSSPNWLNSHKDRLVVGKEIELLLQKPGEASAKTELSQCPIGFARDQKFYAPKDLFKADESSITLFGTLLPEITFIDSNPSYNHEIIIDLVHHLTPAVILGYLEELPPDIFSNFWESTQKSIIFDLIDWFITQDLTEPQKRELSELPIWPTSNKLYKLQELFIPGDFNEDPLQTTAILDPTLFLKYQEFFRGLGVKLLTLQNYVQSEVPKYFQTVTSPPKEVVRTLIGLLAKNVGRLNDNNRRTLQSYPIIECQNENFYTPAEVYLPTKKEVIIAVFGEDTPIAANINNNIILENFYKWIRISEQPRHDHIVKHIKQVISQVPSSESITRIKNIFLYLGELWKNSDKLQKDSLEDSDLTDLKTISWLLAENDGTRWHSPREVYAVYRKYIFESQAKFLDIPQRDQNEFSEFIKFVGIKSNPTPSQVVEHLLWCSKNNRPVNHQVYEFLSNQVKQEDQSHIVRKLKGKPCLWFDTLKKYLHPHQVFWNAHPFGRYRFQLVDELRKYDPLFKQIGVKDFPDIHDTIQVIEEISQEFGSVNKTLDDETNDILLKSWKLLGSFEEPFDLQSQFKGKKVIPNEQKHLYEPEFLFFKDRPHLAEQFENFIVNNVINKIADIWPVMLKAGVRYLSKAVDSQVDECESPQLWEEIQYIIIGRKSLLRRVFESNQVEQTQKWPSETIQNLEVFLVNKLAIHYSLKAFNRVQKTSSVPVTVFYDQLNNYLYVTNNFLWQTLARELVYAFQFEGGNLASGFKDVLEANSFKEAKINLDELGYSPSEEIEETEQIQNKPLSSLGDETHNSSDEPVDLEPEEERADGSGNTEDEEEAEVFGNTGTGNHNRSEHIRAKKETNGSEGSTHTGGTGNTNPPGGATGTSGARRGDASGSSRPSGTQRTGTGGTRESTGTGNSGGSGGTTPWVKTSSDRGKGNSRSNENRDSIDEAGIQKVIKYETEQGRLPEQQPHLNPGYDIVSRLPNHKIDRYIEVKSTSGSWEKASHVALSKEQFKEAKKFEEQYWLYVVEYAESESDSKIHRIQNPTQKIDKYIFDHHWESETELQ
ncbi:MAG: DUF3883 domain-containing protein [SAR324 cluster bacterium]|nr:DUF3883 domain-containing protein [SAR324 cluster bacterium]